MKLPPVKVKHRKAAAVAVCGPELSVMLSCWATHSDHMSVGPCKEFARQLATCMANTPRAARKSGSSMNYHLKRLSKRIS